MLQFCRNVGSQGALTVSACVSSEGPPEVVNQSEYTEFYKTTFKAFDEPLSTTHFKVEGTCGTRA
eukprot:7158333-Pyramimonas_sp.AAC.1